MKEFGFNLKETLIEVKEYQYLESRSSLLVPGTMCNKAFSIVIKNINPEKSEIYFAMTVNPFTSCCGISIISGYCLNVSKTIDRNKLFNVLLTEVERTIKECRYGMILIANIKNNNMTELFQKTNMSIPQVKLLLLQILILGMF